MDGQCGVGNTVGYEPVSVDLVIYQGDDFLFMLAVSQPDGTPVDLTGATAAAQIRTAPDSPDVVAGFDATIPPAEGGTVPSTVTLSLDHTTTAGLPAAQLVWDAQLTGAGGQVTTLAAGRIRVIGDVTRPAAG